MTTTATHLAAPARAAAGTGAPRGLLRSTAADVLRLRRWPALWVLVGVWLLLNVTFAYLFNYIAYATGSESFAAEGVSREALLADLLPAAVPGILTDGMPMFGGAIMLTLGALAVGSGYGWGTWKTALTQGPGRATVFGGTLVAVALGVVLTVLATLAVDLGLSASIAAVEGQAIAWPGAGDLAQAVGGGLLVFGMWAAIGVLVGVLPRSPAIAIGLGLVWSLVVENLLRGTSGLLSGMEYVTDVLPGTAAGSVAGSLSTGQGGGAPGVLTVLDGGTATLVTAAYLVAAVVVSLVVVRRRDVA